MWISVVIALMLYSSLLEAVERCDASFHAIDVATPHYSIPRGEPESHSASVLFEFVISPEGEIAKVKVLQSYSRPNEYFTNLFERQARKALLASRFTAVENTCIGKYRFIFNPPTDL